MKKKDIIDAYAIMRTTNQSIPDDVLDFMKNAALAKLEKNEERLCGSEPKREIKSLGWIMFTPKAVPHVSVISSGDDLIYAGNHLTAKIIFDAVEDRMLANAAGIKTPEDLLKSLDVGEIFSSTYKEIAIQAINQYAKIYHSVLVKTYSENEVIHLLQQQRLIALVKFINHTDLSEEDIYNMAYPSTFSHLPSKIETKLTK